MLDLDAIEKAAREAQTRGPWHKAAERSPNWSIVHAGGPGTVAQWCLPGDAAHMAASHPDAVLAMVAEIRELRAQLDPRKP